MRVKMPELAHFISKTFRNSSILRMAIQLDYFLEDGEGVGRVQEREEADQHIVELVGRDVN